MSPDVRLAVLTTRARPEERLIFAALERQEIPYVRIDESSLLSHLGSPMGPYYRGVLNRTHNAYVARLFEATGHRVFNQSTVVDTCADRLLTSVALVRAGVPTLDVLAGHESAEGHEIRVVVIGGEAVAAASEGAACSLTGELEWLAQHAAEAVGGGMLAVDMVARSPGELLVTKVGQLTEFHDLAELTGVDVAELIVKHVDRNSPQVEWAREQAA